MPSEPDSRTLDCVLCRQALLTPTVRNGRLWRTALNRNQDLLGKLIIVLRRHEEDVTHLTLEEWSDLRDETAWAVTRLREAFAPDHFNYAFLQNLDRHVHLHVIPRYAGARRIGTVHFQDPDYPDMFRVPGRVNVVDADVLAAIASALTAGGTA